MESPYGRWKTIGGIGSGSSRIGNEIVVDFDKKTVIYSITEFEKYRQTHQLVTPLEVQDWNLVPTKVRPSMFSTLANVLVEVVAGIALIVLGAASLGFVVANSLPSELLLSTGLMVVAGVVVLAIAFPLGRLVAGER